LDITKERIRIKGKDTKVNSLSIDSDKTVIATGKFIKIATINDEWDKDVTNPAFILEKIKQSNFKVDLFTFMQRLPEVEAKFNYYMEWDNVAAIPLTTYDNWWKNQASQEIRNKIRKAKKKGVEIKLVEYNDDFVRGISAIYNEVPIRQGKPFWHYGKDFEALKEMHATFIDRSYFIGAYYGDELIGFVKLVNAGKFTRTMHILSKVEHRDKAPTNALLAKSVEFCCEKNFPFLVYGQFDYGNAGNRSLTAFKRDNGFQKILIPRYWIPLNMLGQLSLKFNLHHRIVGVLPKKIVELLLNLRSSWYLKKYEKIN